MSFPTAIGSLVFMVPNTLFNKKFCSSRGKAPLELFPACIPIILLGGFHHVIRTITKTVSGSS